VRILVDPSTQSIHMDSLSFRWKWNTVERKLEDKATYPPLNWRNVRRFSSFWIKHLKKFEKQWRHKNEKVCDDGNMPELDYRDTREFPGRPLNLYFHLIP